MAAAAPPQDAAPEPPSAKQRAWLEHAATPEQLSFFAANGYLPIPQALDAGLLGRVTAVVDEVAEAVWSEKEQAAASAGDGPEPRGEFNHFPCVLEGPAMLELLAAPPRFAFRAPSPVAALCVTPDKPFVFGASVAEPRAVTPGKKPFVFGASR